MSIRSSWLAFPLVLGLLAAPAHAAAVKLTAAESRNLIQALATAGVPLVRSETGWRLQVEEVDCAATNVSHGREPSEPLYGLQTFECRVPSLKAAAAKVLYDALAAVQSARGETLALGDCAMGKCFVAAKRVACSIDASKPDGAERFSCELDDGRKVPDRKGSAR